MRRCCLVRCAPLAAAAAASAQAPLASAAATSSPAETDAAAAAAEPEVDIDASAVFRSTYRALRRFGEPQRFLRRAINVYDTRRVLATGTALLRHHRALRALKAERQATPWYRQLRRLALRCRHRKELVKLGWTRSKVKGVMAIADVLVVAILAVASYVIYQSVYIVYIGIWRNELARLMAQPIIESLMAIEAQEKAKLEAKVGAAA